MLPDTSVNLFFGRRFFTAMTWINLRSELSFARPRHRGRSRYPSFDTFRCRGSYGRPRRCPHPPAAGVRPKNRDHLGFTALAIYAAPRTRLTVTIRFRTRKFKFTVTKKQPNSPDFETALSELEKIVERMEKGDQNLEEALKEFERGVELTRICQQSLKEAEQRVEKLVQKEGKLVPEPYVPEE